MLTENVLSNVQINYSEGLVYQASVQETRLLLPEKEHDHIIGWAL